MRGKGRPLSLARTALVLFERDDSNSVKPMRRASWLLAVLLLLPSFAGNGTFCARSDAILANCCSSNCPAGSRQAGRNCCHLSDTRANLQSAVPATKATLSGHTALLNSFRAFIKPVALESSLMPAEPEARSDPLSLLCSRQI